MLTYELHNEHELKFIKFHSPMRTLLSLWASSPCSSLLLLLWRTTISVQGMIAPSILIQSIWLLLTHLISWTGQNWGTKKLSGFMKKSKPCTTMCWKWPWTTQRVLSMLQQPQIMMKGWSRPALWRQLRSRKSCLEGDGLEVCPNGGDKEWRWEWFE